MYFSAFAKAKPTTSTMIHLECFKLRTSVRNCELMKKKN
ncbi:hypothetical protein DDD_1640 [Nonlabens dokdonensis DSW-6]|uniref:Uncharacterized protein n=1 Tax=Nonlabens dokdonensis (strain DSM 17205 / KCTC 12402 / DSW-6) TaxID=592029 RepID=L7W973_NONDD|nr:hypothetical protein DDD_1640 [Nonlabens dokdonensis DSW-6]